MSIGETYKLPDSWRNQDKNGVMLTTLAAQLIYTKIGRAANVVSMTPLLAWLGQLSASLYIAPIDTHHPPTPPRTAAPPHKHSATALSRRRGLLWYGRFSLKSAVRRMSST